MKHCNQHYEWGVFKTDGWECIILSNDKAYCERFVGNRKDIEVRHVESGDLK